MKILCWNLTVCGYCQSRCENLILTFNTSRGGHYFLKTVGNFNFPAFDCPLDTGQLLTATIFDILSKTENMFPIFFRNIIQNLPMGSTKLRRGKQCQVGVRVEEWWDSTMFSIENEREVEWWNCRCRLKRNQQRELLFCSAIGILWHFDSYNVHRPRNLLQKCWI